MTRETRLKVLELTAGKYATMFDTSMGFRHGPKSFLDDKTLLFDLVSNNAYTRQYDIDVLEEVKGDGIAKSVMAVAPSKIRTSQAMPSILKMALKIFQKLIRLSQMSCSPRL